MSGDEQQRQAWPEGAPSWGEMIFRRVESVDRELGYFKTEVGRALTELSENRGATNERVAAMQKQIENRPCETHASAIHELEHAVAGLATKEDLRSTTRWGKYLTLVGGGLALIIVIALAALGVEHSSILSTLLP